MNAITGFSGEFARKLNDTGVEEILGRGTGGHITIGNFDGDFALTGLKFKTILQRDANEELTVISSLQSV